MILTSLALGLIAVTLFVLILIARLLKRTSTWLGNFSFFILYWSMVLLIIVWILPLELYSGISLMRAKDMIPFISFFTREKRSFIKLWIVSFSVLTAFGFCLPMIMKKQTLGAVTGRTFLFVLPVELLGGLSFYLGKTTAFFDFGVLLLQLPGVALGYWFFTVFRELPFIQKAMPNRRELD